MMNVDKLRDEVDEYYEKVKKESFGFSKQDYIDKISELFSAMELYKVRWFYLFIIIKEHFSE